MMRLAGSLLVGCLFALSPSAFAQDIIFRPPKPPPVTQPTDKPRQPAPAAPSCVIATITLDARNAQGDRWDPVGAPDILATETITGATASCEGSFSCDMRIVGGGRTLRFSIVEDDAFLTGADDPVGSGQCRSGQVCTSIPATTITFVPC